MNNSIQGEIKTLMGAAQATPAVSIIISSDRKKHTPAEIAQTFKSKIHQLEKELLSDTDVKTRSLILQKLHGITDHLNFNTHAKGIAVFVSPAIEQIFFLDIDVDDKLVAGKNFEIRDMIQNRLQENQYLLLVLGGKESRIFLGTGSALRKFDMDHPDSVYTYISEAPEKVSNFSDKDKRRQTVMDSYLRGVDKHLEGILHNFPLPVFVMGVGKMIGHFRTITKHDKSVVDYINGNHEEDQIPDLLTALQPRITDLQKRRQQVLLNELEAAAGSGKLVTGVQDALAMSHSGRLLLLEKNFAYSGHSAVISEDDKTELIPENSGQYNRDAADEIIENVFANGGDVQFVEPGLLKNFQNIALIKYY